MNTKETFRITRMVITNVPIILEDGLDRIGWIGLRSVEFLLEWGAWVHKMRLKFSPKTT
jgi:hypothetical protein